MRIPLSERRTKDETSLSKVVHAPEGVFLSEWTYGDIAREPFGLSSKRPMVYLSDPHESLEKAIWCYEQGMVPLLGEPVGKVAQAMARAYRIDSLIADARTLPLIAPAIATQELLESLSIIGSSFDIASLLPWRARAKRVRLVLALPETGAFAEAELEEHLRFSALPHCTIKAARHLILTKDLPLVTPIVRYDTGIRSDSIPL